MDQPVRGATSVPATRDAFPWIWRVLHDHRTAWVILIVSVVLTALAWYISDRSQAKLLKERFVFRTTEVDTAIVQRMKHYELVLRGGVALFEASEEVTRDEWKAYVHALHFREHYPGIQAMGFSQRIPAAAKAAHVAAMRAEFPEYAISPDGERDEYHSVIYIEPFDARNQRAFGFDMSTEPVRRAAMDEAIESGQTTVSGMVTLKQEMHHDVQRGFLMYIPVFSNGAPRTTVEERRKALRGYVYAAFRGNDLMGGIFGGKFADLDYWIFDGKSTDPSALVFQNHPGAVLTTNADLSWANDIEVVGHPWTVRFVSSSKRFDPGRAQPLIIAFGGLLIDVLLFVIVGSLARTQDRAVYIANQMTAALRRSLKEKDILLQEVHHRVKNNLQMISSLIGLQLRKLDNAAAQAALEECQGRVLAIALIHEKLYQVAGSTGIQFADYVRDLATSVAAAAEGDVERVKLEFEVQPLALDVGQAIPCGLIVQELLSNVFKHAYEDGAQGTVTVELAEQDGLVTLAVRDDGVGFPKDFDPNAAASLGLRLVRMLSEQLEADLQTSTARGACTAIRFARQAPAEAVAS